MAAEDELEMRDLQALRREGNLAVGSEPRRANLLAKRQLGVGGRNDENGSLNLEHVNLSSLMSLESPQPDRVRAKVDRSFQEVWVRLSSAPGLEDRLRDVNDAHRMTATILAIGWASIDPRGNRQLTGTPTWHDQ